MGNATKSRTPAPQPIHNEINRRLRQIMNEANLHQRRYASLMRKINTGTFNEVNLIHLNALPSRMRALVNEKNRLERMQRRFI